MFLRLFIIAICVMGITTANALATKPYVLHHPKAHCKVHYIKKIRYVRKHHHRIKQAICMPVKPKPKITIKVPAPVIPKTTALHAHLDPSFVQDPKDPRHVTYSFSASATQTSTLSAQSEPAPLPEGVLELFTGGALACAVNVDDQATGSECLVKYEKLGTYKVTVTYLSGTTSATETTEDTIEPFTTKTVLSVTKDDCPATNEVKEWTTEESVPLPPYDEPPTKWYVVFDDHYEHTSSETCTYNLSEATIIDQTGASLPGRFREKFQIQQENGGGILSVSDRVFTFERKTRDYTACAHSSNWEYGPGESCSPNPGGEGWSHEHEAPCYINKILSPCNQEIEANAFYEEPGHCSICEPQPEYLWLSSEGTPIILKFGEEQ